MKLEELLPEIRKGRKFKRPAESLWRNRNGFSGPWDDLDCEDLMADDWILQPNTITVCREDLANAWDYATETKRAIDKSYISISFSAFCESLGL